MLRKLSTVIILALILVPLAASAQGEKKETNLVGVTFDSHPEFAEVRVDGVFIGTTPLPYRLTPGVHKIEMARLGSQVWSRELFVNARVATGVTALLEERDGKPCGK